MKSVFKLSDSNLVKYENKRFKASSIIYILVVNFETSENKAK